IMFAEIFVDVRTPEEIELLSIDSTHHIEWQEILNIKEIASLEDRIYLFCRSGVRSENAKNILINAGYTNVFNIGGFKEASEYIKEKRKNP
ncbi:rhodanese-like domain-containing protein, partial [Gammaproteobacteria bacterium]|nr:rhodanese-like domain-containing protein [Gammaproteobacteria bacterium]